MFTLLLQNFGQSSSSDSNFEPNGAERANTRVIHKFTELFSKGSGKNFFLAMSPQKLKIQLYRVRQSFPEPSGFQYSERTIASTETNFTSTESP